MEKRTGPDGETLYLSSSTEKGNKGPFRIVYVDAEGTRRWGYFCMNCESFDTAVDSMGRIQCNQCSNFHKAEEWDAAHE